MASVQDVSVGPAPLFLSLQFTVTVWPDCGAGGASVSEAGGTTRSGKLPTRLDERVRLWVLALSGLPWLSKRGTKLPASVVTLNLRLPEPLLSLGSRKE